MREKKNNKKGNLIGLECVILGKRYYCPAEHTTKPEPKPKPKPGPEPEPKPKPKPKPNPLVWFWFWFWFRLSFRLYLSGVLRWAKISLAHFLVSVVVI